MKADSSSDNTEASRGSAEPLPPSSNPLEIIDTIGAQVFDVGAIVALLSGAGLTALVLLMQLSTWFQTGNLTTYTAQFYFPLDVNSEGGPTPSSAFNGLILLVWQNWIGFPLLAISGFCFLLCRKIASEFRR